MCALGHININQIVYIYILTNENQSSKCRNHTAWTVVISSDVVHSTPNLRDRLRTQVYYNMNAFTQVEQIYI